MQSDPKSGLKTYIFNIRAGRAFAVGSADYEDRTLKLQLHSGKQFPHAVQTKINRLGMKLFNVTEPFFQRLRVKYLHHETIPLGSFCRRASK